MPVRCIFDSMAKRVVVEAAETLTVADIRDVVLRVVAAGAISFSKLFDSRPCALRWRRTISASWDDRSGS